MSEPQRHRIPREWIEQWTSLMRDDARVWADEIARRREEAEPEEDEA